MSGSACTGTLEVSLNGAIRTLPLGTSLHALVNQLRGWSGVVSGVAVALNEEVVPRSRWASTQLNQHDRIEVLVASPGG